MSFKYRYTKLSKYGEKNDMIFLVYILNRGKFWPMNSKNKFLAKTANYTDRRFNTENRTEKMPKTADRQNFQNRKTAKTFV